MDSAPSNPDIARIDTRQIRIDARDPRSVCFAIGLKWENALMLFREGFVSFDLSSVRVLDESQDAELVFVGSLAAVECRADFLRELLRGLRKPYSYDLRRLYFDWRSREWRVLPGEDDPEGSFFDLLNRLGTRDEKEVLLEIREWLYDALDVAEDRDHLFSHVDQDLPRHPPERRH